MGKVWLIANMLNIVMDVTVTTQKWCWRMIDKKVRGNLDEKSPNAEGGTGSARVHRGGAGQTRSGWGMLR